MSANAKMYLNSGAIQEMDRVKRLKLLNAVTGIKPANLLGTADSAGHPNLAIFSSVVHLGSDPALIGLIMRPTGEVPRHTYENIRATGVFTINHVHSKITEKAHYTSAKFDRSVSEFDRCGLEPAYLDGFHAPFVKESKVRIGLNYEQEFLLPNDTLLIIGSIAHLYLDDMAFDEREELDVEALDTVGTGGLNTYYKLQKCDWFPYARKDELPWEG